jgi:TolB-like protein
LLYSRRSLEIIITDLCECELNKSRGTEPLKGIIDKLQKEEKVPYHIIASMHGLNTLSTFGTHPKDFDPEQVKPVLNNLLIIIKWYSGYKDPVTFSKLKAEEEKFRSGQAGVFAKIDHRLRKRTLLVISGVLFAVIITFTALVISNVIKLDRRIKGDKSIAVLPFAIPGNDTTQEYISYGLVEEILDRLCRIGNLKVISHTSSARFKNSDLSLKEIARELGASAILEGSVQKSGNKMRITVQLIDAKTDTHLWSNKYDNVLSDIFSIYSQVAQSVARELNAVINPEEKQLIEKIPTDNLEAHEAYLKGQFYLYKSSYPNYNNLDSALKYFEKAKDIDPEYAQAYAGICDVWAFKQQGLTVTAAEGNAKSMAALMRAIELDSTISEVQYSLAHKKTWGLWDWEGAESAFKKSISLNPNNALAHAVYSNLLNIVGRPEEAMEHIKLALKLDPMNPIILLFYGLDLDFIRKYDEEIKVYKDIVKIEPSSSIEMAQRIGWTLFTTGHYNEAFEQFKIGWSNDPDLLKAIEQGYTENGWKGLLISYNEVCEKKDNWSPIDIAGNYALLGDNDKAMYWLERAYENHDPNLPYVPLSPFWDNLRNDPRFQDLCRRMKLPYR